MEDNRAFTLIELLVVVSIISLLSSVVLSSLNTARDKARLAAARSFSAQADRVAGDMAIGIWNFDDCSGSAASDSSLAGNTGTLTNMSLPAAWSADTFSGSGCSLSFDGSNDYVATVTSLSANSSNPVTLVAWVKTSDPSGVDPIIGHAGGGRIDMWKDGSVLRCRGYDAADNSANGTSAIDDGKWHFLACVFDSTGVKAYVDGKLQGTNSSPTNAGLGAMYIGRSGSVVPSAAWNGLIDGPRIFSKSLVASEIEAVYAREAALHELARR